MTPTAPTDSSQPSPRYRLSPGPRPATIVELRTAQVRDRLLRTELARVRTAAAAWRNGLGALLAALIGFSLIKGRSDVGQLTTAWAAWVGVLLLLALVTGTVGALLLIRAAHGRPAVTATRALTSVLAADHLDALASTAALRRGIAATLGCTLLLVAAVGATWYGPEREKPSLQVTTSAGAVCGSVVRLNRGVLVLKTTAGEVATDLTTALTITAVGKCP
ncbi:hypothetical protein ACN26Y_18660 [Micromonospora sp. WMMD558]|uniref:hypothetical protein n=1 Tax=unclassified Micromonospora TaxID=2617518 RepID=UPI0012B4D275|nr:hypothetical protein [Micromonospora sp. WMMC415]QGN48115.1 hypothetical protein GKC29_15560 [Micromonospora sp. WMMC415]